MRMVTETLEVSRSNIQEQVNEASDEKQVHKSDDRWLIPLIKEITDTRPTYGYGRKLRPTRVKSSLSIVIRGGAPIHSPSNALMGIEFMLPLPWIHVTARL